MFSSRCRMRKRRPRRYSVLWGGYPGSVRIAMTAEEQERQFEASKKQIAEALKKKHDEEVAKLEKKIEDLEIMVKYQPGGEGYEEAKHHFEELQTQSLDESV